MMFISTNWDTIKKHLLNILMFLIGINIMTIISFAVVFNNNVMYISDQLDYNIFEYQEVDREQLCKISDCVEVRSEYLLKAWTPNEQHNLKKIEYTSHNYYEITNVIFFDGKNISLYNEGSDSYYVLNLNELINDYISIMNVFAPLSLLLFIYPLIRSIRHEQEESLILLAGNEALLANKTMINITENVHHELNTPLEVIDNKIEKIHREMIKLKASSNGRKEDSKQSHHELERSKKLQDLEEDFVFIKNSSEQIYSVLSKMKGFKNLRYSNGNKTIKDIIDGGFKVINMSNTNFEYEVDEKLNNFSLEHKVISNVDLLSVVLNHIKNSLEANASKIYIVFISYNNNILNFRIIDNGNGIPMKIQKHIFKPNFSSKSKKDTVRGNGMYLNKHIINTAGGDINLVSSSLKGTTMELCIPAKEKEK